MLEIRPEPPRQPEVIALLEASDAAAQALYPPESNHLLDVSSLEKPTVRFFVARRNGTAIGCGSIVLTDDGTAEIKRMFVAEEARGTGAAQALMATLEATARAEGVTALRLETGSTATPPSGSTSETVSPAAAPSPTTGTTRSASSWKSPCRDRARCMTRRVR